MSWTEVALACVASFVLTVVFTRLLIPFLKARQLGKVIRADGPDHQAKAGTPTMGGLGMLAAVGIVGAAIVAGAAIQAEGVILEPWIGGVAWALLGMIAFAGLGLVDDWQGLARKGRAREIGVGLTARSMLLLQLIVATLIVVFQPGLGLWYRSVVGLEAHDVAAMPAPWTNGLWATLIMAAIIVGLVGLVNGVNLADGLDGLCSGLLAMAFGATGAVMMFFDPPGVPPAALLCLVAAAACLAFLVFNHFPAKVFMGNVASMGLGGLLGALSLANDAWLFIPIIGAVFVVEVVSDIIQIVYFKRTGGQRFFLMAPIHHHFEKLGWPETKVVTVFWSCGLVAALAGVGLAAWLARS